MDIEFKTLLIALKHRKILIGELSNLTNYPENAIREIIQRNRDVVRVNGEEVTVVNPVQLALKLVYTGVELRKITELLDWRDFEVFSTRILMEFGYEVVHEVKLTTPVRFEVDVLGIDPSTGLSIAIDCKHWSSMSTSRLLQAAETHIARLHKLIKHYPYAKSKYKVLEKAKRMVPLILTLLTPRVRTHVGVLFISIGEFPQFLRDIHSVLEYFDVTPLKLN
ncbi:MAG: hypothetical protein QXS24_03395 [Desulfurococcaceae archaeon]